MSRHPLPHPLLWSGLLCVALAILPTGQVLAQEVPDWTGQTPGHAAVVDGPATLERDGVVEPLEPNTILLAGDRLRTDQGRIEVIFGDGSVLDVDAFSSVDILSDTLLRLLDGRVRLIVTRSAGAQYRIDAAGGTAVIRTAGEYRVASGDVRGSNLQFELAVYQGSAELRNRLGTTIVRPGTYAVASPGNVPSLPYPVNSAAWDDFDAWADEQRDARLGFVSAQYLPADLRYYGGTLDRAGSWDYASSYGQVWYPQVAADWSPYSHGTWAVSGRFGWTWVGLESWSWPTHHYGRWGHQSGRWFWIPDGRWAPAWVSWASAPGYVSWSPLGFNNRPLVSLRTVSLHTGPRLGWSVIPAAKWGPRVRVTTATVPHHRVGPDVWTGFSDVGGGPAWTDAKGRRIDPPATTGRAVPRQSAQPSTRTPGRPPSRVTTSAPTRPSIRTTRPASPPSPPSPTTATSTPSRTPPRDVGSNRTPTADRPTTVRRSSPPPPPTAPSARPTRPESSRPTRVSPGPTRESGPPRARTPPRTTRPAPQSAPSRGGSVARPRSGPPPASSGGSAGVRGGSGRGSSRPARTAAPPRAAPPSSSAQPNRGTGRTAPPRSSGRGQARPRSGG